MLTEATAVKGYIGPPQAENFEDLKDLAVIFNWKFIISGAEFL